VQPSGRVVGTPWTYEYLRDAVPDTRWPVAPIVAVPCMKYQATVLRRHQLQLDKTSSMESIKRPQDESESLRFLTMLAAGRLPARIPNHEGLVSLAVEHKMHGLVASALDSGEDDASNELRTDIVSVDGQTWARHVFLTSELSRVTSSFGKRGVEHYVIKGPAIERRFYDRIGERPFGDLDVVLLAPFPIVDALEVLGDTVRDPAVVQDMADDGWIQSVDVTLPSGALVDLHLDPLKLGFQSRFSRSVRSHLESMTIDGTTIETLDPTASLIVALVHLNRNRFRQLSGFADVARILTRSEIDWDAFADLVRADGLEVLIDGSLRAVRDELDLDEDLIVGWTSRSPLRSVAPKKVVWNLAWRPSTRLSGLSGRFRMGRRSQFLMPALCRGRSAWVIRWMTRRLVPPPQVLKLNHPSAGGPYLVRLISGRWNQFRHNRFHRAGTRLGSHQADDDLAESSE